MRQTIVAVLACVLTAAPLSGQSPSRSGVSVFFGAAWTELAGGIGQGGTLQPGPLGVALQRPVARRFSWRGEVIARVAGSELREQGSLSRDGTITRGELGIAGLYLVHFGGGEPAFFAGLGTSLTAETHCDVDLIGGGGFLGGETVACEEWDEQELTSRSVSSALVATAGVTRGRLGVELRLDYGAGRVITTPEGDMHMRSLAAVVSYRFRGGDRP